MTVGYKLPDGKVLFVSDGISSGHHYCTFYRKPSGSLRRFLNARSGLPERISRIDAEKDLEEYAAKHKLTKVEVEEVTKGATIDG